MVHRQFVQASACSQTSCIGLHNLFHSCFIWLLPCETCLCTEALASTPVDPLCENNASQIHGWCVVVVRSSDLSPYSDPQSNAMDTVLFLWWVLLSRSALTWFTSMPSPCWCMQAESLDTLCEILVQEDSPVCSYLLGWVHAPLMLNNLTLLSLTGLLLLN